MRYFFLLTAMLMSASFGAQGSDYTALDSSLARDPLPAPPMAPPLEEPTALKLIRGNFSLDSKKWTLSVDETNQIQSNLAAEYLLGKYIYQFPLQFPNAARWNQLSKQFEVDAFYIVDGCQYPAQLILTPYKSGAEAQLDVEAHYAAVLYTRNCTSTGDNAHKFTFVKEKSTTENLVGVIHYTGGFVSGSVVETKDTRTAILVRVAIPKFCKDVEISEVDSLQTTGSKLATLSDPATFTYEINGKEGLILSGVKVSLNGPPHQECDIPVYASFVEPE